ncbi:hypothetical protein [uncultured Bacteroides sp.]|uniref:hypothetical protein n=1 Tax=uncultured Bacteroides sp. TaxID=162156 RepID=UPI002AAC0213|nr:hypothetical protein [uncultured Bacteroides sp.]
MNNGILSESKIITLEDIASRKAEVLKEIQNQKRIMTEATRDIFAPYSGAMKSGNAFIKRLNTGMALFDGVILGIRMMKKIRKMFK